MANDLQKAKRDNIVALFTKHYKEIKSLIPKHLPPEKMTRLATIAIHGNSKLMMCSDISLLNAVLEATSLGLEIGGPLGLAHLVPFGGKASLIVDYKGYIQLIYQSDRVSNVSFHPVYAKDRFEYKYGSNKSLIHKPNDDDDPGPLKYAYACVYFKDGGKEFEVVNKRLAMAAKAKSAAKEKKDSPWNTEDEWTMWCKTAVRRLAKRVPLTSELQKAAVMEEKFEAGIDQGISYVDEFEVPNQDTPPVDVTPRDDNATPPSNNLTPNQIKFVRKGQVIKAAIGEPTYYEILGNHGYEKSNQVEDPKHMKDIETDWDKALKATKP